MSSATTKHSYKGSKRRKIKSQPVTSSSKPGSPGPSTSLNLNLPVDSSDSNTKSQSGPDPSTTDLASQLPPSPSLSSSNPKLRTKESEPEPVLNVIGTPALPSYPSTPAPIPESKPKAEKYAAGPPKTSSPPPSSAAMPKDPEPAALAPFSVNEEFVAFTFSDSDEETAAVPIREWDQGKQGGDAEKRGKKRKSGEMSRDDREYDRDGKRDRGHDRDRDRDRDRHGERRRRMENVPRHAPWVANVDWDRCPNVAELYVPPDIGHTETTADVGFRLQKEVEAFMEYVSPTKAEDEVRGLIVDLITRAVVRNFPDAKVMPFGSFETKLYLPSG